MPREFAMIAYGGAGPLHACGDRARTAASRSVIIPRAPGHFSAYGMLVADLRRDFVRHLVRALWRRRHSRTSKRSSSEMEADGRARIWQRNPTIGER